MATESGGDEMATRPAVPGTRPATRWRRQLVMNETAATSGVMYTDEGVKSSKSHTSIVNFSKTAGASAKTRYMTFVDFIFAIEWTISNVVLRGLYDLNFQGK